MAISRKIIKYKNNRNRKTKKRLNTRRLRQKGLSRKGLSRKGLSRKSSNKKDKLVIGIVTVPLSPGKKYFGVCGDSYIATAHINWIRSVGMEILPIPFTTTDFDYYVKRVNGLYLPSGGAFALNQIEYYNCCKNFIKSAIRENENGNYFPVWGGCMGMQQMMMIGDNKDNLNLLTRFDSFNNLMLPLDITKEGLKSKLLSHASPRFLAKLQNTNCTLNNHKMGLSPSDFKKSKMLHRFYKIISTNKDRKGKEFVSTIEARDYPFYGVQWHPERGRDMQYFIKFFKKEASKAKTVIQDILSNKIPQHKRVNCMTYSNNLYKYCDFYWHTKTSAHNKKLCSVATLGKPITNGV
jgi:imidazoleglycerol phosphate synthase glutamine amidotransferase subunit HisH